MLKWLIVFLFVGCSNASRSNKLQNYQSKYEETTSDILAVAITINTGDHEDANLVSFSDSLLSYVLNNGSIYMTKSEIGEFVNLRSIVSERGFEYFTEYIVRNCNPEFPKDAGTMGMKGDNWLYTIKVVRNTGVQNCYYLTTNKTIVSNYFQGMSDWLSSSKYKKEFSELLEYLDWQIKLIKRSEKK